MSVSPCLLPCLPCLPSFLPGYWRGRTSLLSYCLATILPHSPLSLSPLTPVSHPTHPFLYPPTTLSRHSQTHPSHPTHPFFYPPTTLSRHSPLSLTPLIPSSTHPRLSHATHPTHHTPLIPSSTHPQHSRPIHPNHFCLNPTHHIPLISSSTHPPLSHASHPNHFCLTPPTPVSLQPTPSSPRPLSNPISTPPPPSSLSLVVLCNFLLFMSSGYLPLLSSCVLPLSLLPSVFLFSLPYLH
ncbi:hypothetical protein Pcinc_000946 [Petrolisthes cinctipes]|uniref:Uncharacterized protein n=1 Tax=Petrolisthes cinctipes TaxID=88211 RepID=A0AAE1GNV2_PETCI|nr:hypothetical protein Pcinc_000946 [Petrolisthes cinctipes]